MSRQSVISIAIGITASNLALPMTVKTPTVARRTLPVTPQSALWVTAVLSNAGPAAFKQSCLATAEVTHMRNEMRNFKDLIRPIYVYNIEKVRSYLTLNTLIFSVDKKNQLDVTFVFFISLLIVAQHVSGNHVPIIRS